MKVLWLTGHDIDFETKVAADSYYGRGWVSSLQKELEKVHAIKLGVVLLGEKPRQKHIEKNVEYFTIQKKPRTKLQKFLHYYNIYSIKDDYSKKITDIIQEFQPDVIHLFGFENCLNEVLNFYAEKTVVHTQGVLGPYANSFFPPGFSIESLKSTYSIRETIFRNGFLYNYRNIKEKSINEVDLFKKAKYILGRTHWDYKMKCLLSPDSIYFNVNEMLRDIFYENKDKAKDNLKNATYTIISTISPTFYKGYDFILKTASLLMSLGVKNFKWQIAGLSSNDEMINIFEKKLNLKNSNLNIEFLGKLKEDLLCKKLLESDVYVHPSYIDNSPNSVCEAQLLGLPVIACNVGGVSTLVAHNTTGFLIPSNEPYEASFYISKLISDKKISTEIGYNSYLEANNRHNKESIIIDLLKCYNNIIENNKCLGKN